MNCSLCLKLEQTKGGNYPYLIHDFKHSYLMLGEHQFYQGYCVLVLKEHFREMTDLPSTMQMEFFQEMMVSFQTIEKTFRPKKMNMCCLGNVVDHVHWHFFPRYEDDPDFFDPPWLRMKEFFKASITPEQALESIKKIKMNI